MVPMQVLPTSSQNQPQNPPASQSMTSLAKADVNTKSSPGMITRGQSQPQIQTLSQSYMNSPKIDIALKSEPDLTATSQNQKQISLPTQAAVAISTQPDISHKNLAFPTVSMSGIMPSSQNTPQMPDFTPTTAHVIQTDTNEKLIPFDSISGMDLLESQSLK